MTTVVVLFAVVALAALAFVRIPHVLAYADHVCEVTACEGGVR